jgi:rare lipoprotein A
LAAHTAAAIALRASHSPQQSKGIMMALNGRRILFAASCLACSAAFSSSGFGQSGIASVYSGEHTANGEFAHAERMTAAHRSLPFGTLVKVTHTHSGRFIVVRINDRGPFVRGRVIDLTPAAAHALGFSDLAPVTIDVIGHS